MQMRNTKGRFSGNSNGFHYGLDPITMNGLLQRFGEVINSTSLSRQALWQRAGGDPRRDIDDECGYPKEITREQYKHLYDRFGPARRVVDVWPDESWMVQPSIFETEDLDNVTEFEQRWADIDRSLRGESWFQDDEGSPIWEALHRADRLSGVGAFGGVLIGLNDSQRDLRMPAEYREEQEITFLRTLDESLIEPTEWEQDPTSPRFGHPNSYLITLTDPEDQRQGRGMPLHQMSVHWTRFVHMADNLDSSELFGTPRMRSNYDRLVDLRKLYGGSAEMYWKGAFPGYSFETHPQLGGQVSFDTERAKDQMEQFFNGLQRYLFLKGMSAQTLSPQVVNPTPQINVQLEAIAIDLTIPKRIFMGSERGELASGQDARRWNNIVRRRQNLYVTPRVIVPFVNRLISLGVLPKPTGFSVAWPDLNSLTPEEVASIAQKRTDAIVKYVQAGADTLILPLDFLTRILGLEEGEALEVIGAVEQAMANENRGMLPTITTEEESDDDFSTEEGNEAQEEEEL